MRLGESKNDYKKVSVTLANGESTALQVTPGGVMVSERKDVEPIIPMGMLVQKLGCRVDWNQGTLKSIILIVDFYQYNLKRGALKSQELLLLNS